MVARWRVSFSTSHEQRQRHFDYSVASEAPMGDYRCRLRVLRAR